MLFLLKRECKGEDFKGRFSTESFIFSQIHFFVKKKESRFPDDFKQVSVIFAALIKGGRWQMMARFLLFRHEDRGQDYKVVRSSTRANLI